MQEPNRGNTSYFFAPQLTPQYMHFPPMYPYQNEPYFHFSPNQTKERTEKEPNAEKEQNKKELEEKLARMNVHFVNVLSVLTSVHENEPKISSTISKKVDKALKKPENVEPMKTKDEPRTNDPKKKQQKKLASLGKSDEQKFITETLQLIKDQNENSDEYRDFCETHKFAIDENATIEEAIDTLLDLTSNNLETFENSSA